MSDQSDSSVGLEINKANEAELINNKKPESEGDFTSGMSRDWMVSSYY